MTRINENIADVSLDELTLAREEIRKLKAKVGFLNGELLQYAHIISHDLQEPLRKIQIYSGILRDRGVADPDVEIVDKIIESSSRMSTLINDILAYSKSVRAGKIFRPVNLNDVAAKIIHDFELSIQDCGAIISVDSLPVVNALALEMDQLFYNLIDNALKFADPARTLEIAIRCKKISDTEVSEHIIAPKSSAIYYDISIRDNGIGFNVDYAEKIFKVFGRLHPKGVYSGTGIGLSLCRIIVDNHGGALFAESVSGEGSALHIIIPNE